MRAAMIKPFAEPTEVLAYTRMMDGILDIACIIQDAATWLRVCAPSSIWPTRLSLAIARRHLDGECGTRTARSSC
jgi:hypothetical protein